MTQLKIVSPLESADAAPQAAPTPDRAAVLLQQAMAAIGYHPDMDRISESWRASPAEHDPDKIADVAEDFAVLCTPTRLRVAALAEMALPLLVLGPKSELALLTAVGEGGYTLERAHSDAEEVLAPKAFRRWFSGDALLLEPATSSPSDMRARLAALNPLRTLGLGRFAWIALAAMMSNVLGLASSLFVMVVYDKVIPNKATESLYALAIGVAIAMLFDSLLKSAKSNIVERASARSDIRTTSDIFDQFVAVSNRKARKSIGELASIVRDFEMYRDFMTTATILTFVDLPFILVFILVIQQISGALYLVPLIAVPVVLTMVLAVQPLLIRSSRSASRVNQSRQSVLVEVLSGLEPLRVSGAFGLMKNKFMSQSHLHLNATGKARSHSQLVGAMVGVVQQVVQVAIIVFGFHLFVAGEVTMGAIIAAVILSGRAMGPLARIGQTLGRANQALVAYRNLRDFLSVERQEARGDLRLAGKGQAPGLEISNVTLRLAEDDAPLYSGLDLSIAPGEKIAVVGRTGAGKSSLLRLVSGLIAPETGVVRMGGVPVQAMSRAGIHHHIGMVFQHPWLFAGTLRENVALGDKDIPERRVQAALAAVGMEQLDPNMQVADQGATLSGGQRQAVNLARAICFDPSVYLLDEPTSAMDSQLEAQIVAYFANNMRDKTMIVVTHKAKLLELCDRVVVVDQGRIIQDMSKTDYLSVALRERRS